MTTTGFEPGATRAPTMARVMALAIMQLLAGAAIAVAQTPSTSELHGTVTDQTGGRVVGASVALESATDQQWGVKTDRQGRYTFDGIPPGLVTLTVSSEGFRDFTAPIQLLPGRATSLDVGLTLGLSVSLDVSEPAGISTDPRKNLSALILTGKDIERLPDDPQLFMLRLFAIAGSTGKPGDVAVYVDGFREYKRLPPKDTIEMIRINSNPFSAEFFQASTKRIEITTKPGSDSFHGDARFQFRDSRGNARNPMAITKPPLQYRDYNGYLQGPISKGRVGFLVYGGQWRQEENAIVHATVLDPATSFAQAFGTTVPTPTRVTSMLFKTDVKVLEQLINVTYTRTNETHRNQGLESGFDLPERAYDRSSRDDVGRLWWTSTGRHAINDVRVEITRSSAAANPLLTTPAIVVLDAFSAGGNQNAAYRTSTAGMQASEDLTVQLGRHTWKTGVQLESTRQDRFDRSGFGGTFTFGSDAERDAFGNPALSADGQPIPISPIENYRRTVLGLPGYGPSQFSLVRGTPQVDVAQWNLGWFALDDWSMSKRFSLSYGVRQELQANVKRRLNLAPRVGLSWLLDDEGMNAVKIGTGVFYTRVDADITLETNRLDGRRQQQLVVQRPPLFTTIPASLDFANPVQSTVYTKSDNLRMPYALITSVSYERMLPWGLFGVVEYRFNKGVNLLRLRDITTPVPAAPNAVKAPPVFQFESTGRSLQRELTLGLRGNVGAKFTMYSNYTWGRKYSDTDGAHTMPANSYDLSTEYGPAADDQRHQLVAGASVEVPRGIYITPYVAFASRPPFNITTGRDNNNDTIFADRPAFAKPGDSGAIATPYGLLNPNPQSGDPTIPRNFGREPNQVTLNLTVLKNLPKGVMATIDVENLFNQKRLVGSNGVLTSPAFGIPNRALSPRRLELAIQYGF